MCVCVCVCVMSFFLFIECISCIYDIIFSS